MQETMQKLKESFTHTCANIQIQRKAVIADSGMAIITILDNNAVNWRIVRIALNKHGQDGTTVAVVQVALDSLPVWTHLCIRTLQDSNVRDRVQSNIAAALRCGKVGEVEVHKAASGVFVEILGNPSVAGNKAIVLLAGSDLDVCYRGDAYGCIDTKRP